MTTDNNKTGCVVIPGYNEAGRIGSVVSELLAAGHSVLVGNRMDDPGGMPAVRRWTNRFMSPLLSRRMGQYVPDTQNGFRLYRCDVLEHVQSASAGFAAESEVLLNLAAAGIQIGSVPVRVIYGDEKSKIRPVRDTLRFYAMLRRHDREWQRTIEEGGETC